MNEQPITAEQVIEVAPCRRDKAERIATYTNHRMAGLLQADASRETGISIESGQKFERWIPLLRAHFDLPEVPAHGAKAYHRDHKTAAASGAHQRHHVTQGVTSPGCPLCQTTAPAAARAINPTTEPAS